MYGFQAIPLNLLILDYAEALVRYKLRDIIPCIVLTVYQWLLCMKTTLTRQE